MEYYPRNVYQNCLHDIWTNILHFSSCLSISINFLNRLLSVLTFIRRFLFFFLSFAVRYSCTLILQRKNPWLFPHMLQDNRLLPLRNVLSVFCLSHRSVKGWWFASYHAVCEVDHLKKVKVVWAPVCGTCQHLGNLKCISDPGLLALPGRLQ